MNREIKFRCWDRELELMYQWRNVLNDWKMYEFNTGKFWWMQFTGLKDKNNVDIYEGDIVKIASYKFNKEWLNSLIGETGEIKWIEDGCEYWVDLIWDKRENSSQEFLRLVGTEWEGGSEIESENIEVIGNIYQNKELLK